MYFGIAEKRMSRTSPIGIPRLLCISVGLLTIQIYVYGSPLDCFICKNVATADDCHHVDVCTTDTQRCFTKVQGTAGNLTFTYGCKEEAECVSVKANLIGRRAVDTQCHQCCAQPACNKILCSSISPIHSDNMTCTDDPSIDCKYISSLFHVCDDIHHAKKVCKKWCGLCDLVDGNWGSWDSWTGCSVTCENGTQSRNRLCDNPAPAHGGLQCIGDGTEYKDCLLDLCPAHGHWSSWEHWTKCSTTCGYGVTKRVRYCNNPPPERFGQHCFGEPAEVKTCYNDSCVVDGGWSAWSAWAACSSTCGIGLTSQFRSCDSPIPQHGGLYCRGDHHQYKLCDSGRDCIDSDHVYSSWSGWYPCQHNIQYRNRSCFVFNDVFTTSLCNDTDLGRIEYRPCGPDLG